MRQLFIFTICGIINTFTDWLVYYTGRNILGIIPELSKILGTIVGISVAFLLNSLWVFRKEYKILLLRAPCPQSKTVQLFFHFFFVYLIGMTTNFLVFTITLKSTNQELLALLLATMCSLILNFLLIKRNIFTTT